MMTDVEDEDDWATSDELADDDNDSNAVVAESALDRYLCLNIIISMPVLYLRYQYHFTNASIQYL